MNSSNGTTTEACGYAPVNGLEMYYEIEGTGDHVEGQAPTRRSFSSKYSFHP